MVRKATTIHHRELRRRWCCSSRGLHLVVPLRRSGSPLVLCRPRPRDPGSRHDPSREPPSRLTAFPELPTYRTEEETPASWTPTLPGQICWYSVTRVRFIEVCLPLFFNLHFLDISLFTSSFPSKSQQEFEWLGSFRASTILWLDRGRGGCIGLWQAMNVIIKMCSHIFGAFVMTCCYY